MTTRKVPLADYLDTRADWFELRVVKAKGGGWDIDLRIDGTYSDHTDAAGVAEWLRAYLEPPARARRWRRS